MTKASKYLNHGPLKARVVIGKSAWWYYERVAISIYIERYGHLSSCKIRRSELKKFVERTK